VTIGCCLVDIDIDIELATRQSILALLSCPSLLSPLSPTLESQEERGRERRLRERKGKGQRVRDER